MPPQPVNSVRRNADIVVDPLALKRHPQLAAQIGEIVAIWSRIDSGLGGILARMLGGSVRPTMAMYGAITSKAQIDALEAAAKVSLRSDDLVIFHAVLDLVKRAGKKRHKIAHWLWGESDQIKDALILVDPDAILDFHVEREEATLSMDEQPISTNELKIDSRRSFVYKDKNFIEIIEELSSILRIVSRFTVMIIAGGTNPLSAIHRSRLLSEPQIRAFCQGKHQ